MMVAQVEVEVHPNLELVEVEVDLVVLEQMLTLQIKGVMVVMAQQIQ